VLSRPIKRLIIIHETFAPLHSITYNFVFLNNRLIISDVAEYILDPTVEFLPPKKNHLQKYTKPVSKYYIGERVFEITTRIRVAQNKKRKGKK
jgi:hypothetical protein